MKTLLFLILFFNFTAYSQPEEQRAEAPAEVSAEELNLKKACASSKDLEPCAKLATFFLDKSQWEKSYTVANALCENKYYPGCTIAGSAKLAVGDMKEAEQLLRMACDNFEPLSCRSLGRLYTKAGENSLGNMFFKRSCFYGLKEVCPIVKETKKDFSAMGLNLLEAIHRDCNDPKADICKAHFITVSSCALPLITLDCIMLSVHMTFYFQSKLLQDEARVNLLKFHADMKQFKEKTKSYTYDLGLLMKDEKPFTKNSYVLGFMKGCAKKYASKKVKTNTRELYAEAYAHQSSRTTANILTYFSKGKGDDCYGPKYGYEAYAVGSLDPVHHTHLDVWKIDQDGKLENIQDGRPLP